MEGIGYIPVVDFSALSLDVTDKDLNAVDAKRTAAELIRAFSTVGFVYLKNTSIPTDIINLANNVSGQFFILPDDVKMTYKMATGDTHGWNELRQQSLDLDFAEGDFKETFNVTMRGALENRWPSEIADFKDVMSELFQICSRLAHRVLFAIGLGLDLPDPNFFSKCHDLTGNTDIYATGMRMLYYPPATGDYNSDSVRLGAHTDFGTITLLFQDAVGGLEVRTRDNTWVEAVPIQDTILVNIADLLQRWTGDRLVSTAHRIIMPQDEIKRQTVRRSIAFFVIPDYDTIVSSLDGPDKYPPVSAGEYLKQRVLDSYR